jgi:hypothetical protein
VDHSIRKGFMKCHFDIVFTSIRTSKIENEAHELFGEWRDGCDGTCERLSQLDERDGVRIARQKRKRLSLSHSGNLHLEFFVPLLHGEGNRLAKCRAELSD